MGIICRRRKSFFLFFGFGGIFFRICIRIRLRRKLLAHAFSRGNTYAVHCPIGRIGTVYGRSDIISVRYFISAGKAYAVPDRSSAYRTILHSNSPLWEPLKTSLTANFLRLCASSALAKLEIHQVFTAFRCLEAAQSPNENLLVFRFLENPYVAYLLIFLPR